MYGLGRTNKNTHIRTHIRTHTCTYLCINKHTQVYTPRTEPTDDTDASDFSPRTDNSDKTDETDKTLPTLDSDELGNDGGETDSERAVTDGDDGAMDLDDLEVDEDEDPSDIEDGDIDNFHEKHMSDYEHDFNEHASNGIHPIHYKGHHGRGAFLEINQQAAVHHSAAPLHSVKIMTDRKSSHRSKLRKVQTLQPGESMPVLPTEALFAEKEGHATPHFKVQRA